MNNEIDGETVNYYWWLNERLRIEFQFAIKTGSKFYWILIERQR